MNDTSPKGFYAYPSYPAHIDETINEAIKKILKRGTVIEPWRAISPTGQVVIQKILERIDKADFFCCDITGLNPNVMFELGYAISKGKRIWITINTQNKKNLDLVKEFDWLSSIGYLGYVNDDEIVTAFLSEAPHHDLHHNILDDLKGLMEELMQGEKVHEIVYYKSIVDNTSSRKLTKFLESLKRKMVIVDIFEDSYQPLSNALLNVLRAKICICHLSNDESGDKLLANAKYSAFAGMAHGFAVKTLLVAQEPFSSPFDYKDMLIRFDTAANLERNVKNWLYPILAIGEVSSKQPIARKDTSLTLIRFVLGDGQAEHEEDELDNYFIETSSYHMALNSNIGVFVGRKGAGKTANLYQIRNKLLSEKSNLVVLIKPVSFKLETYVKVVTEFFSDLDIQSELTERIWEFITYTAIAFELYQDLTIRNKKMEYTHDEHEFIKFVEDNNDIITADFGEKLDFIYDHAKKLKEADSPPKKILQEIFQLYLTSLRNMLKGLLKQKGKIAILVDNLDKAWDFGKNINLQCKIIYGLIGFHNTLIKNLDHGKATLKLLIFLREDIFDYVLENAREPDKIKLNTHTIEWDDKDLLMRVVVERFIACDDSLDEDSVWNTLFCEGIDGVDIKTYLYSHIIPRPRDLIYLVQASINESINHQHEIIEAGDIQLALRKYYEFIVANTITEYKLFCPRIKELLHSFYASPEYFGIKHIAQRVKKYATSKEEEEKYTKMLFSVSLLGLKEGASIKFAFRHTDVELLYNQYSFYSKKILPQKIQFSLHPAFAIGLR